MKFIEINNKGISFFIRVDEIQAIVQTENDLLIRLRGTDIQYQIKKGGNIYPFDEEDGCSEMFKLINLHVGDT